MLSIRQWDKELLCQFDEQTGYGTTTELNYDVTITRCLMTFVKLGQDVKVEGPQILKYGRHLFRFFTFATCYENTYDNINDFGGL